MPNTPKQAVRIERSCHVLDKCRVLSRELGDDQEMKVLAVSVGLPREVVPDNRPVSRPSLRPPVSGRIPDPAPQSRRRPAVGSIRARWSVRRPCMPIPHEHYAFWRGELPDVDLQPGHFGENLTVEGLNEDHVHVGDRLKSRARRNWS